MARGSNLKKNDTDMKKTYLKPETTVVALNVRENVLQASTREVKLGGTYNGSATIEAREVIDDPDAWEEEW